MNFFSEIITMMLPREKEDQYKRVTFNVNDSNHVQEPNELLNFVLYCGIFISRT